MIKKTKIRQTGGLRGVHDLIFSHDEGDWVAYVGPTKLTIDHYSYRCTVTDTRNGYFRGFHTMTAAKAFAKHRAHGRSIVEHQRVEKLKDRQEWLRLSLKEFAEHLGISPRTLEAYYSGCRAVPETI